MKSFVLYLLVLGATFFSSIGKANTPPVAKFNAYPQTGLGQLLLVLNGEESADPDGSITSYTWNFGDSTTGTGSFVSKTYTNPGTYTVTLTVKDNLNVSTSISKTILVRDTQPPVLSIDNPYHSNNIFVKNLPITVPITVTANEFLDSIFYGGEYIYTSINPSWTVNRVFDTAGMISIPIRGTDLAYNESSFVYQCWVILDNTAPTIEVLPYASVTNKNSIPLSFVITDAAPTTTQVKINGSVVSNISQKNFTYTFSLPVVGNNVFEIKSTDAAGNISAVKTFTIKRDNVVPVLSALVPANNATVDRVAFNVSGSSSKKLTEAFVNSQRLTLAADGLSFTGVYAAGANGIHSLNWRAKDVAGNLVSINTQVNIVPRLLIGELVSIMPDPGQNFLLIVGAKGATRPGAEVSATEGLFSWNRSSTIANSEGAFVLKMDPFSSVELKAKDVNTSETATLNLNYLRATTLSGIVKDSDNNPLPGVTVKLAGTNVVTDGSGVFSIASPRTGDQTVEFDGGTVPSSITGTTKKFTKSNMVVSIGLGQSNVLAHPIYLTPLMLDGTETTIANGSAAVVTSTHAPGVALSIPSGVVNFPNGTNTGAINLKTIAASRSTIPVSEVAVPTSVIALEPSGTSFTERVELVLPNDNELPPGVEFALLSMNSEKGIWEIDGFAEVTQDGQSVKTKPGQGISHFSIVYAVPLSPKLYEVGDKNIQGVNISKGAFSTQIELPSYRSGSDLVTPTFRYNSSWSNPTAVVSNMIHVPEMRTIVKKDQNNEYVHDLEYEEQTCILGYCYYEDKTTLLKTEIYDTQQVESWYQPESIKSQFFIAGIASDEVVIQPPQQSSGTNLPGGTPPNSISSSIVEHAGIPNQAVISYAVPLVKPNGDFLETGIYPTLSRYQIRLKNMVITTSSRRVKQTVNGEPYEVPEAGWDKYSKESRIVEKIFPSDVVSAVIVQNKTKSPFGRGWELAGTQKILNPNSRKVAIEEANGEISTYVMDSTVSTLFNAMERNTSITEWGTASLKQWPNAFISEYVPAERKTYLAKVDLTSTEPQAGTKSIQRIAEIKSGAGSIGNLGWSSCPANYSGTFEVTKANYVVRGVFPAIVQKPDGKFVGINQLESSFFEFDGVTVNRLAGHQSTLYPNVNMSQTELISTVEDLSDWSSVSLDVVSTHPCTEAQPSNPNRENLIYSTGAYGIGSDYFVEGTGNFGTNPSVLGLGKPRDFVIATDGSYIVADFGNNTVKKFNPVTTEATNILGDGTTTEHNLDGVGNEIPLFHPTGLVYDGVGNLYVSTGAGYIRKLRPDGTTSVVAGLPVGLGGIISDEAPAKLMNFVNPSGLAFDSQRNFLYVSDSGNHRVVRVDMSSGIATTVAGTGSCDHTPASQSVSALLDSLCNPTMISLDDSGNLVVLDYGHGKIKKVSFEFSIDAKLAFLPTKRDSSKLVKNEDGTWTRTYRSRDKVSFSPNGSQTASIDRAGRATAFQYANGLLSTMTDSFGQITTFNYSSNKLSSIVDPASRTTRFYYTGDLLTKVSYPDGTANDFEYDQNGLMTKEYNRRFNPKTYVYNKYNRLERVVESDGTEINVNDFETGSMSNDYVGGTIGQLKGTGTAAGKVNDAMADAKGNETVVSRSFNGFVVRAENANGEVTTIERDLFGNPQRISFPDGRITEYAYDPQTSDVLQIKDVGSGNTQSQTFDQFGNVTSKTNGRGQTVTREYDLNSGMLVEQLDAMGNQITFAYFANGLLQSKTVGVGASARTWTYEYNSRGHTTRETAPGGIVTDFELDFAGNVTKEKKKITSSIEKIITREFDTNNRLTKVISPKGEMTQYQYLNTGELSRIILPNYKFVDFEYDNRGRLLSKTEPSGVKKQFTYDLNGNVLTSVDSRGQLKKFTYDSLDRMATAIFPDETIEYQYNSRGDITQIKNQTTTIQYSYDTLGKVTEELLTGQGAMAGFPSVLLEKTYDEAGNRVALETAFGNIAYSYDYNDKLTSIANSWGDSFQYTYDAHQRVSEIARPGSSTQYAYNSVGQASTIQHISGGIVRSYHEYDYDLRGFITQRRSSLGTKNLTHDENGQLVAASSGSVSETFSYDAIGNRMSDQASSYVYDGSNQLLMEDIQYSYYYDGNGNLTYKIPKDSSKNGFQYYYNSRNQLVRVEVYQTPFGLMIKQVDYVYDVVGRRIQKSTWDRNYVSDPTKTYTRKWVYDGDNALFEFNSTNQVLAKYTYGLRPDDILSVDVSTSGVTAGLAQTAGKAFFAKDIIGSTSALISSTGTILQSYEYDSFGKIRQIKDATGADITSAPLFKTPYTFTGREWDDEVGLYYYRARYYDPKIGRFLQQDPHPGSLGEPLSAGNKYQYANNSPYMFADPSGMISIPDLGIDWERIWNDLGSAWDQFIKSDFGKGLGYLAIGTLAIYLSPAVALLEPGLYGVAWGLATTGYQAWLNGNRSWEALTLGLNKYFHTALQPIKDFAIGAFMKEIGADYVSGLFKKEIDVNLAMRIIPAASLVMGISGHNNHIDEITFAGLGVLIGPEAGKVLWKEFVRQF